MNAFTIKDLENLSGVKAHTLRIWEQRYSFLRPQRTTTNIRYYNNEQLKTILNVALLNKFGFRISQIDKMSEAELGNKLLMLTQTQAQQERLVNELIQHMIDLDLESFEGALDNYILNKGIEKAINQIIFQFLERIGVLWMTNHVNPAQEHFVTNIIRQKLIVGIASSNTQLQSDKSGLLFLPEGEHHELGLLFIHYLLKTRGIKIWYLGANVPEKDVEYVLGIKSPTFAYTHLTSMAHNFSLDRFLKHYHTKMGKVPLIISGRVAQTAQHKVPENVLLKRSLSEVMEFIATL